VSGLGTLLRAYLRRDRWMILWWSVAVAVLYYSQAISVDRLYSTPDEFRRAAATMGSNSAFVAMAGPPRALDTIGGQVTWQSTAFGAILVGLMSMFLIGRHTRAEEESGRDELLRAAPIDRHAPTTAALLVGLIANAVAGTLTALALVAYPLAVADSVALGVGVMVVGWLVCGLALLAVQVTATTRAAYAITGVALAAAYVLRAVGDISAGWLSWCSPIGWYQAMHAFSGLRWWPILLPLVGAVVMVSVAHAVFDRRDFGAGLIPDRPGPPVADAHLTTPLGLEWRLQRATVIGWTVGMFAFGLAYGSFGTDVGALVGESETAGEIFNPTGAALMDGFYAMSVVLTALVACGFAISSALRPRADEDRARLEPLLATALSRTRWLGANVAVTVGGVVLVLLAAGVGMGISFGVVSGRWSYAAGLVTAMLQMVAPVLVLAGLAILLYGIRSRFAGLAWIGLALCAVVLIFGELLRLPRWFRDLSPFEHLALMPAQTFGPGSFVAVSALAVVLFAGGLWAFGRRDVH